MAGTCKADRTPNGTCDDDLERMAEHVTGAPGDGDDVRREPNVPITKTVDGAAGVTKCLRRTMILRDRPNKIRPPAVDADDEVAIGYS